MADARTAVHRFARHLEPATQLADRDLETLVLKFLLDMPDHVSSSSSKDWSFFGARNFSRFSLRRYISAMPVTTVGIDLAKNIFLLNAHDADRGGKPVFRKRLRRHQFAGFADDDLWFAIDARFPHVALEPCRWMVHGPEVRNPTTIVSDADGLRTKPSAEGDSSFWLSQRI